MSYPISSYLNVRDSNAPTVRADGKKVAFITNITGLPQVWEVEINQDGGIPWPDQVSFASDRVMQAQYSPVVGDERLIYTRDVGGSEKAQIFLLDNGVETMLTEGYEDAMHLFGGWSKDGDSIVFAANRRNPGLFDLYVQRLDGKAELVWENQEPGFIFIQSFSSDGKKIVFDLMHSSFNCDIYVFDLDMRSAKKLNPEGKEAYFMEPRFSLDGEKVYVTTDLDWEFVYIAEVDLKTGELVKLVDLNHDISGLKISPDGKRLGFVVNEGGYQNVYAFELESKKLIQSPLSGGVAAWYEDVVFFADSSKICFSFTSPIKTVDIYAWDIEMEEVRQLTRSSQGGIAPSSFIDYELIHYPTFDDREIPAWLVKPEGKSSDLPVVVIVHGGPEGQFYAKFHPLTQYFVDNGYAVLIPNVRGSTGYGKTYHHLDDVEKRMDSVNDLAHAAYWIREQEGLDGDRIAVYGGSYGGFMVLSALTTYPDLWAVGVDIVGISNFVTFLENTSEYRRAHREAEYGSLEHDREFLESIAPMNHLDKLTAPLMVIHGANDPRVPLSEAEQLVKVLEEKGNVVEFMVFEDEGHGIVKLKNKLKAYPAVVEFFDKHLKGD